MIETLFPKTVNNILDFDAVKAAAKKYVEEAYAQIVTNFANNLVLQFMDSEHLEIVAEHVTGDKNTTLTELLDYINAENIYRECDFVSDLTGSFPAGVTYELYDVTGWKFPDGDISPFNLLYRSWFASLPTSDPVWLSNAQLGEPEKNLLLSRFCRQFDFDTESFNWHRKEGRRASWGNTETWMTTGGFGKPGTIHINVDEERSVIEENGLTAVENWLGTVSHKLPINLYIEIISNFTTNANPASSSLTGYSMAFPYEEEEGFCTNDPDWPEETYYEAPPSPPDSEFLVIDSEGEVVSRQPVLPLTTFGTSLEILSDNDLEFSGTSNLMMPDSDFIAVGAEQIFEAYFTSQGSASTSNFELSYGNYALYHADGSIIDSDSDHVYTVVKLYDYSGNEVTPPSAFYGIWDNVGTLCAGTHPTSGFYVYKLTYEVTES